MENSKTYKRFTIAIIVALLSARISLSLFFYKEVMFRSSLPLVLDGMVVVFLLVFGYIKYRNGEKVLKFSLVQFLVLIVAGLLIYLVLTTKTHRRQVDALTRLIENAKLK